MYRFEIFGIHILELIFLIGLLGSAVVAAISFVEDIGVLFSSDREQDLEPHAQKH